MRRKSGRNTGRPVWISKLLLNKLKHEKEGYEGWKAVTDTLGEMQTSCLSSQVRKTKAMTELNLARDVNGSNKIFCRYVGGKRKTQSKRHI